MVEVGLVYGRRRKSIIFVFERREGTHTCLQDTPALTTRGGRRSPGTTGLSGVTGGSALIEEGLRN